MKELLSENHSLVLSRGIQVYNNVDHYKKTQLLTIYSGNERFQRINNEKNIALEIENELALLNKKRSL